MIIYVDIDDTICKSPENTNLSDKYKLAEPLYDKINKINKLYDNGHTIIYWTARGTLSNINFFELTYDQLKSWGVKFHELRMGKPAFDLLIDDKTFNMTNPEVFDKLINQI
jgi:hypothetical protein